MSHFARVKTNMKDREAVKQALSELDFQYEEGRCTIRGWSGGSEQAEIKIAGQSYDIGFRQAEGVYEAVADWWGVARDGRLGSRVQTEKQFVGQVTQRYGYVKALALLEESGYQITQEYDEQGEIVLEAVRYY